MILQKQKLLLDYVISDPNLYAKVHPIFNESYFDPKLKRTVEFINRYYELHKSTPTPEQVKVETGESLESKGQLSKSEESYAATEIESFCRNSAIRQAIMAAPALLDTGNFDTIIQNLRGAITVGLQRNIGIDYFHDPEERLREMLLNDKPIPTGWAELDEHIGGGLNRKEMIVFAAASGIGKSLTLSNLARNLLAQRLNGVYITLELSEKVVAKRFDSMMSGIGQADIMKNISKVATEVIRESEHSGRLFVKRMPESTTNCNHIRAYLKEFELTHGFTPDFIIVDYLELLTSNNPLISPENLFVKDKYIAEELRSIANDFNALMATASQLNRSTHEMDFDDVGQAQIAGGISKINTTDNLVAILQDEKMRALNQLMFRLLKTRSSGGVGNLVLMDKDPLTLRITCHRKNDSELKLVKKDPPPSTGPAKPGRSLLDIMKV